MDSIRRRRTPTEGGEVKKENKKGLSRKGDICNEEVNSRWCRLDLNSQGRTGKDMAGRKFLPVEIFLIFLSAQNRRES